MPSLTSPGPARCLRPLADLLLDLQRRLAAQAEAGDSASRDAPPPPAEGRPAQAEKADKRR